jgi:aminotransferase
MPELSNIVESLAPSGIRRFFDIAATMKDIVSLGVGEPDFVTPWAFREAAIYSIERGQTQYTSNYGLLELRELISNHISSFYGVKYDFKNEILVTVGVSEGMDLAMRVLLNPGDEVILPLPCYVSYQPCVILAGGVVVGIETTAETHFVPTVEQLEAAVTPRTKAIMFGYPSNPTGGTLTREQAQDIVNFAIKHDLYIISDEIYDRLTYEGQHVCIPSLPGAKERTILLNGFSKAYAMTGWRLGYACAPEEILSAMVKIHAYTIMSLPIPTQRAAIQALTTGEPAVKDMVSHYNRRRRLIVAGLNEIGLECHLPNGAFYAFPSIKVTGLTSEEFAERLLFEEQVAVVPGTAFGSSGEGHVRCSYATSIDKIELAITRIDRFVKKNALIPPSLQPSKLNL